MAGKSSVGYLYPSSPYAFWAFFDSSAFYVEALEEVAAAYLVSSAVPPINWSLLSLLFATASLYQVCMWWMWALAMNLYSKVYLYSLLISF